MPGFNKNGPAGQGPMSGRGMGVCGTASGQDSMLGRGRGAGSRCRMANGGWSQGRGMGLGQRGFGQRLGGMNSAVSENSAPVVQDEKEALRAAYEAAQQDIARLKKRLDALENGGSAK